VMGSACSVGAAPHDVAVAKQSPTASPEGWMIASRSQRGVPPDRVLECALRLVAGAAYRAHRVSVAAHHETHSRVQNMPYTFPNFVDFTTQVVRMVLQLGVAGPAQKRKLDHLVAVVQRAKADLQKRIERGDAEALPAEARAAIATAQAQRLSSTYKKVKLKEKLRKASGSGSDAPRSRMAALVDHLADAKQAETVALAKAEAEAGAADGHYLDGWSVVVWESVDEDRPCAVMPHRWYYEAFMPAVLEAFVAARPGTAAESEADLDAWFEREKAAGDFEPFGSDVLHGWAHLEAGHKRTVMLAWESARGYLNGPGKRRERDEPGARHRGTGCLSSYVPFVDAFLGRTDVKAAAMRLSFPYYIGTSTWLLQHVVAEEAARAASAGLLSGRASEAARVAQYKRFLLALGTSYPCPYCRHHFNAYVSVNAEDRYYPVDYLIVGWAQAGKGLGSTLAQKIAEVTDGPGLRLFVWKLHNAVNSSIQRSEEWFRRQDMALVTSRFWPSTDAEVARAEFQAGPDGAQAAIPAALVGRVHAVDKGAVRLELLRERLVGGAADNVDVDRAGTIREARALVRGIEQAVVASGLFEQYRIDHAYRGSDHERADTRARYDRVSAWQDASMRTGMWTFY